MSAARPRSGREEWLAINADRAPGGAAAPASPIRVTFIDQVGDAAGGAEKTMLAFLEHRPASIDAAAIVFEDGAFARELRAATRDVAIVGVSDGVTSSTRERLPLRAILGVPQAIAGVARTIREQRADVVFTNSMKAHVIGGIAARLTRTPCVIHVHDVVEGRARLLLRAVSSLASQRRIACSHVAARALGLRSTTVIYGPVDLRAFDSMPARADARAGLGIPDDLPLVTLAGRINRWKGHDRFVRIAALVNAERPVRFAIVGAPIFRDVDFVPELHRLVDALALRDRVSFVPWVDDIRTVYAATDVNVNFSTREPLGRSAAEAAAAGVPTICFDDSGASETILRGVTGEVVAAGDEAAFARAILRMLRDPAKLRAMGAAARDAAGRFDAHTIARSMAGVIEASLGPLPG